MPRKGERKEVTKDAQIQFRVNSKKKKEIQDSAGDSMGEYLIKLHDKSMHKKE